jgi:hypothetical protein
MTLDINKVKNIFLLHTKTQNYRLKYPNVLR